MEEIRSTNYLWLQCILSAGRTNYLAIFELKRYFSSPVGTASIFTDQPPCIKLFDVVVDHNVKAVFQDVYVVQQYILARSI